MAKWIIEIEEKPFVGNRFGEDKELFRASKFNSLVFDEEGLRRLKKAGDRMVDKDAVLRTILSTYCKCRDEGGDIDLLRDLIYTSIQLLPEV